MKVYYTFCTMKIALLLSAVFVLLALADGSHSRGCIYILGNCVRECEEGTHAYAVGCDFIRSERTCDSPESTLDRSVQICDYSRCECDYPTVKDTTTGKCVLLEDCPKKDSKEEKQMEKAEVKVEDAGDRV